MKLVINTCYGGFSLSDEALKALNRDDRREIPRNDPDLVRIVEELGTWADGPCAKLKVVDVPSGTKYRIEEYDGTEWIEYADSIKWQVAT